MLREEPLIPAVFRAPAPPAVLTLLLPALLLSVVLAPVSVGADEGDLQSVFGETLDVRVVNVEVVVTDRRGERVTGLGPADFRLVVDGVETPIDYFSEIRGGVAAGWEAGETAAPLPAVPAAPAGERVGTSYLVFIDDYFPLKRDRDRVLRELSDQLDQLAPGDRMAMVVFDGNRIELLTSWTDSIEVLRRALAEVAARPALGLQRIAMSHGLSEELPGLRMSRSSLRLAAMGGALPEPLDTAGEGTWLRDLPPGQDLLGRAPFRAGELDADERYRARGIETYVERVVSAAQATLRGFASPPGRRVMLLLSGGWPFSFDDFARAERNPGSAGLSALGVPTGLPLFTGLAETANLLGYTLYPIDVPGMVASFGADVALDSAVGGSPFDRDRMMHASLQYLAERTGGRALLNGQRLIALGEVAEDTRSYYWLGFTPARARDDRAHRIRVEVLRRGLEARSRDSFRDLSRAAEADMVVESALLFGRGASAGSLAVTAGPPVAGERRRMEVPLTVGLPLDAVTTLAGAGGARVARLELRLAALDGKNRRTDVVALPLDLRVEGSPAAGATVSYSTRLELRRVAQELVVAVYDPLAGRHLLARVNVEPPREE